MRILKRVAAGILLLATATDFAVEAQDGAVPALAWARQHALPLRTAEMGGGAEDLLPIKVAAGPARVIAFSEGLHQGHEFLTFRNRLFAYLVEQGGVTAYAGETGFTDAVAVDEYVLGRTPYTDEVVRAVFAWGDNPMAENRELVEWLRAYNARPTTKRAVRFYGIDLTGGVFFAKALLAVEAVLEYMQAIDAEQAQPLSERLLPWLGRFNGKEYASIAAPERAAFTIAVGDLVRLFEGNRVDWVQQSSSLAFERAYRNAVLVRQLNDMFRTSLERDMHNDREPGMSENLRWVLEQEGPQGRVFLFAQIGHIEKRRWSEDAVRPPLGAYLHSILGGDYMAIGGLWGGGSIGTSRQSRSLPPPPKLVGVPGALGQVLPKVDGPLYFLDLRGMPSLTTENFSGSVADHFDAVVFFRTISPVRDYAR